MTFRFKREGKFFHVETKVGGEEFTRVQVVEEDARPPEPDSIDASGDTDE